MESTALVPEDIKREGIALVVDHEGLSALYLVYLGVVWCVPTVFRCTEGIDVVRSNLGIFIVRTT